MFCSNCGKELNEGEVFCSRCGTKVGVPRKTLVSSIGAIREKLPKAVPQKLGRLDLLGSSKKWFVASIILMILLSFLVVKEMIVVEVEVLFYSDTIEIGLFEGRGAIKVIAVLGFILAAGVSLLPVLEDDAWKKIHLLPAVLMPIFGAVWFCFILLSGGDAVSEYEDIADTSFSLTGHGWSFLITTVLAVIVSIKNYREIPEYQEYMRFEQQEDTGRSNDEYIAQMQASKWNAAGKMTGPVAALLTSEVNAEPYVMLEEKNTDGRRMAYSFSCSRYDRTFVKKYVVALTKTVAKEARVYKIESNGIQKDITEELYLLEEAFKMVMVTLKTGGDTICVKLVPGTERIELETGRSVSEKDASSLLNITIGRAME